MTPRENLISLLRRKGYEEVPYEFFLCPSLVEKYHEATKSEESYFDYFQMPWRRLSDLKPDQPDVSRFLAYHGGSIGDDTVIDEWGVGHQSTPTSMHMTRMLCPLADADSEEQVKEYPLPTYSEESNPGLKEEADALHARGLASVGNMQCTIWETSWYIRSMENMMMDMMCEEPMAEIMLDRVLQMSISRALLYAKAGVDILYFGDDVGMQQSVMMSEELYCTWLKPRLKKLIDEVRKIRPDILVFYHSCGYIEPFIPHLIDAGVDVLNPIQPECMDFAEIFQKYQGQISFHGTIGTQSVMPFGTPEEVKKEVWKNLDIAGKKGGLFVAPTHLLEPEVPWENIVAYVEACKEYKGQ